MNQRPVHGKGPIPASIMIVGEAPGEYEERYGEPFVGPSGEELNKMLHEAGIIRSECYTTNVCKYRPPNNDISAWIPKTKRDSSAFTHSVLGRACHQWVAQGYDQLLKEIDIVQPKVIIAMGNTALWAICNRTGIGSWRGSQLAVSDSRHVVPTYHPAAVLREWSWRSITIHDLRRAASIANGRADPPRSYSFSVRPNYPTVDYTLNNLIDKARTETLELSVDIETRQGFIACIGLAWSEQDAICIPFSQAQAPYSYWPTTDEELQIVELLVQLFSSPGLQLIGQNFLYDAQYIARYWGIIPRIAWDTMLGHHMLFPGLPKALHFQASMYCKHYIYWKEDGKEWDPSIPEEQYWRYNCEDAVRTFECYKAQEKAVLKAGLKEPAQFQMSLLEPVLRTMIRGIRIDHEQKINLAASLTSVEADIQQFFKDVLGHEINPKSSQQLQRLFYKDFGVKPIYKRGTDALTTDDDALTKIGERHPILRPVTNAISDARSVGVFRSTFIEAREDVDGRMRCSFNIAGTETFRFSSSQNAFGSGMNLQNIPKEGSKSSNKAKIRGSGVTLPDIRKLFIPDEGYYFWDCDLDRADLQVVVWEAQDEDLKEALREGLDLHLLNAQALFNLPYIKDDLRDPGILKQLKSKYGVQREFCKTFIHGTNYGGKPRTMAENSRCTIAEAESFQSRWFRAHPGIVEWHRRTERSLQATRSVSNRFGNRRIYFDRIESILPEALAWQPQSTVALVINRGYVKLSREFPEVHVLLQVHDSLAGQAPLSFSSELIRTQLSITIPYDDPLTIPVGIKTSTTSWGDCA